MKAYITLLSSILLVVSLSPALAQAANNNAALTHEEKALWLEFFGEGHAETQTKQEQQQSETVDSVDLTGQWVGYYGYDKPQGQPEAMFHVIIKDDGDEFFMTFLEPRNHPSEYVQAAVTMNPKRQGKYIAFKKSYGRSNSDIEYNLTISHEGAIMEGTWKINEAAYGRAFFYRLSLEDLKNIKRQTVK